jgi:hypothetical protein
MAMKMGDRYMCMEWGFRASERGLNLQAARLEFQKLMEVEVGKKEEARATSAAPPEKEATHDH